MTSRLSMSGLQKSFGSVKAVDHLSLTIEDNEFMVLVGPTGCGKSTLLRLIAGLERPDAGHIYLDGNRINDVPVGKRGVQLVFQDYALWPHMRVYDPKRWSNMAFAPRLRKWVPERIFNRMKEIMRRVGIEEELSGLPDRAGHVEGFWHAQRD